MWIGLGATIIIPIVCLKQTIQSGCCYALRACVDNLASIRRKPIVGRKTGQYIFNDSLPRMTKAPLIGADTDNPHPRHQEVVILRRRAAFATVVSDMEYIHAALTRNQPVLQKRARNTRLNACLVCNVIGARFPAGTQITIDQIPEFSVLYVQGYRSIVLVKPCRASARCMLTRFLSPHPAIRCNNERSGSIAERNRKSNRNDPKCACSRMLCRIEHLRLEPPVAFIGSGLKVRSCNVKTASAFVHNVRISIVMVGISMTDNCIVNPAFLIYAGNGLQVGYEALLATKLPEIVKNGATLWTDDEGGSPLSNIDVMDFE